MFTSARSLMVGQSSDDNGADPVIVRDEPIDVLPASASSVPQAPRRASNALNISKESMGHSMNTVARNRRCLDRNDADALQDLVADAGINLFGCCFVEVWALSENGALFERVSGGHWMDPAFAQSLPSDELIEMAWGLDREALSVPPGAGLVGTLAEEAGLDADKIHWRQIKSMLNDPFIQKDKDSRMKKLHQIGLGMVAVGTFSHFGTKGVVLYFSRIKADASKLRSKTNRQFLMLSTEFIGASYSIRKHRNEVAKVRRGEFNSAVDKVRANLLHKKSSTLASIISNKDNIDKIKLAQSSEDDAAYELYDFRPDKLSIRAGRWCYKRAKSFARRVVNSRFKWRGSGLHGPPRASLRDSAFVFFGVFVVFLTLLKINLGIPDDFDFDAGWYASSLCIVWALTPAPVGQPRQIVAAHLWNMFVGRCVQYIPTGCFSEGCSAGDHLQDFVGWGQADTGGRGMPMIWKQALAVGLGISGQAYFGILHPPASGLSNAFAKYSGWDWATFASVMMADAVVVTMSLLLLNLSESKQYPMYWLGMSWEDRYEKLSRVPSNVVLSISERRTTASKKRRKPDDIV